MTNIKIKGMKHEELNIKKMKDIEKKTGTNTKLS